MTNNIWRDNTEVPKDLECRFTGGPRYILIYNVSNCGSFDHYELFKKLPKNWEQIKKRNWCYIDELFSKMADDNQIARQNRFWCDGWRRNVGKLLEQNKELQSINTAQQERIELLEQELNKLRNKS